MIDLKHEIQRELSLIDPPDLWDRIEAEAANDDAPVLDLTMAPRRRRPSLWLAVAAVTVLLALVGARALRDDDQTLDTTPATEVPVVSAPSTDDDDPPIEDVQVQACRWTTSPDRPEPPYGTATAAIDVTNHSSAESDYVVRIRVEDLSGANMGEVVASINNVHPDLTVAADAVGPVASSGDAPPELRCLVEDVERSPSTP